MNDISHEWIESLEREELNELEPLILANVSEATAEAPPGSGDPGDAVVWGSPPPKPIE